jgi:hypothetical protein
MTLPPPPDRWTIELANTERVAVSTGSAKAEVSRIFQDPTEQRFARREDPANESATSH